MILAQIHYNSSRGQPEFLGQNGGNDLECKGHWSLYSIADGWIPWCMLAVDLAIPTQIYEELSCGQANVYDRQTDGRTDIGNGNTPSAWKARGKKYSTLDEKQLQGISITLWVRTSSRFCLVIRDRRCSRTLWIINCGNIISLEIHIIRLLSIKHVNSCQEYTMV